MIAVAPDDDIRSFSHRDRSRRVTPADAPARTILAQGGTRIDQGKLERARARVEYQQRHQLAGTARVRGRARSGVARQRSASGTSAMIRKSNPTVLSPTRCAVPDPVPPNPPMEPAGVDEPAAPRPANKVRARKATKRPTRPAAKRATRAVASERVKVGSDTIVMPKSLATNLTPKDLKKLRAVFRRAHKRGKKRTAKASAAKKPAKKR